MSADTQPGNEVIQAPNLDRNNLNRRQFKKRQETASVWCFVSERLVLVCYLVCDSRIPLPLVLCITGRHTRGKRMYCCNKMNDAKLAAEKSHDASE